MGDEDEWDAVEELWVVGVALSVRQLEDEPEVAGGVEAARLAAELWTHRGLVSHDKTTSEASRIADRLEHLAVQIRDPVLAANSSYLATGLLIDRGALADAEARLRGRTVAPTDELAGPLGRLYAKQLIGEVLYHQGRMAEIADSSTRLRLSARNLLEQISWAGGSSVALVAAGRRSEAAAVLDEVLVLQRHLDFELLEFEFVVSWLSEAAVSVGHDAALRWCRDLLALEPGASVGAGATHGTTDLFMGVIDAALGDHESADVKFATAEEHCLRLELPLWVNQTR